MNEFLPTGDPQLPVEECPWQKWQLESELEKDQREAIKVGKKKIVI